MPKPAVLKPAYDVSKVHRVAVLPFEGNGGPAVANEFIRQLLAAGLEVSDRRQSVDAVISGTVIEYKPGNKLMVVLGPTSTVNAAGQAVVVTNPVVSLNGASVTTETPATGSSNSEMVSVNAVVEVMARLMVVSGGAMVWAGQYTYEGLEIQDTTQAVVDSLVKSLHQFLSRPGETLSVKPVPVQKGKK